MSIQEPDVHNHTAIAEFSDEEVLSADNLSNTIVKANNSMEVKIMPDIKNKKIAINSLAPFHDHPFKLYKGQRFTDMVESVRANGVLVPIIVRPANDGKFEILSGHNRVAAASEAGLDTVPAVVREGLTDEEALLIVTETNLIQRSFADLRHSERALAITTHYKAMKKKKGYRSDLLKEISQMTYSPVANKSTMGKLGEQYGLSKDTINRYLHVNELIQPLKDRLDNDEIALRVAVSLSYLDVDGQEAVEEQLVKGKRLTIKIANTLRESAEKNTLDANSIAELFEPEHFEIKVKPVKFSGKFLSEFFDETKSAKEIEETVAAALKAYLNR